MLLRKLHELMYAVSLVLMLGAAPLIAATLDSAVSVSSEKPQSAEVCREQGIELALSPPTCLNGDKAGEGPAAGPSQQRFYHRLLILLRLLGTER